MGVWSCAHTTDHEHVFAFGDLQCLGGAHHNRAPTTISVRRHGSQRESDAGIFDRHAFRTSDYGIRLWVVPGSSTLLIDFQSGYRGAFDSVSKVGRFWRAALLALILVVLNISTTIAAQIAGIIIIGQQYQFIPPT